MIGFFARNAKSRYWPLHQTTSSTAVPYTMSVSFHDLPCINERVIVELKKRHQIWHIQMRKGMTHLLSGSVSGRQ